MIPLPALSQIQLDPTASRFLDFNDTPPFSHPTCRYCVVLLWTAFLDARQNLHDGNVSSTFAPCAAPYSSSDGDFFELLMMSRGMRVRPSLFDRVRLHPRERCFVSTGWFRLAKTRMGPGSGRSWMLFCTWNRVRHERDALRMI